MPDTAHALAPQNPANPKPRCLCGQPWPCARDVTDRIAVDMGEIRMRGYHNGETGTMACRLSGCAAIDIPRLIGTLDRVMALAAKHEHQALRWQEPLPVPSWIPELREAVAAGLLSKEE